MAADLGSPFPNPDQGPRAVLFPLAAGGVALEWRLNSTVIESALGAFPADQAVAKVYLRRLDGSGATVAEAVLGDYSAISAAGSARFEHPVVGSLQAELGLEGRDSGAWLLLARSNRLDSVPQTTRIPVETVLDVAAQPERNAQVTTSGERLERPAASVSEVWAPALPTTPLPTEPLRPEPPFPAGSLPIDSLLAREPVCEPVREPVRAPATVPPRASLPSALRSAPATQQPAPADPEPESASESVAGEEVTGATEQGVGRPAGRGAENDLVSTPAVQPATALAGEDATLAPRRKTPPNPTQFPDPSLATAAPGPLSHGRVFPIAASVAASVATGVATRVRISAALMPEPEKGSTTASLGALSSHAKMDRGLATRQDPRERQPSVPHASGPLAPYPAQEAACIRGQLRVFGSATPGSVLDLGGHRFRVGPGGRFAFTVDLEDPELLASLLGRLPRLPVAERDP